MKEVSYGEVAKIIEGLLTDFETAFEEVEFVVGVSRGGLFPAMVVSTALVRPLVVAYINKQDEVYFDRAE
jgi:hypoxanthine phosphoribosyltransferase